MRHRGRAAFTTELKPAPQPLQHWMFAAFANRARAATGVGPTIVRGFEAGGDGLVRGKPDAVCGDGRADRRAACRRRASHGAAICDRRPAPCVRGAVRRPCADRGAPVVGDRSSGRQERGATVGPASPARRAAASVDREAGPTRRSPICCSNGWLARTSAVVGDLAASALDQVAARVARAQAIIARTPSAGRYGYAATPRLAPHATWGEVIDASIARSRLADRRRRPLRPSPRPTRWTGWRRDTDPSSRPSPRRPICTTRQPRTSSSPEMAASPASSTSTTSATATRAPSPP